MDYLYAVKTLPQADDPTAENAAGIPPEPQPPQQDDARPWAGDLYDEGDESDPAQAYASFAGNEGEQAWLDKAGDGTLTGWIRDETGQVWRYSDPDAWAIDVDDAGMTQAGSTPAVGVEPPVPGDGGEPSPDDSAAGGGAAIEFGTADEMVPEEELTVGDSGQEEEEGAEEDADPEDLEEPDSKKPKKKGALPWS
ncbi:hypothetical protein ABT024_05485 [Streptomyces sp. NPDC002812]|uniref:hypothetical protein n=1 Tax=Streptomyces sp. NPDC002812 TaxID=3154434 RepID=UPI0033223719